MHRFLPVAVCLLLVLASSANAQYQQSPSQGPVPLPPLPPIPPLPGNVQGNGWQGNPYYRYQQQIMQWQLQYPYGPSYYPYGYFSSLFNQNGSPYSQSGSSNMYSSGSSGSNPYSTGGSPYSTGGGNQYSPGKSSQQGQQGQQGDNRAMIRVILPSTAADVWVDGVKMSDRLDNERLFVSPPLEPGHKYQYTIKARWPHRLDNVTQERTVTVTANHPAVVDFTKTTVR
jgi:uncharacterized protein (TIGR03000 family)